MQVLLNVLNNWVSVVFWYIQHHKFDFNSIPVKINQNSSSYPNQPVFPESSTSTWCSASVVLLSWVTLISVRDSVVNFASVAFTLKRIKRTPGSQMFSVIYTCSLPGQIMGPPTTMVQKKSRLGFWVANLPLGLTMRSIWWSGKTEPRFSPVNTSVVVYPPLCCRPRSAPGLSGIVWGFLQMALVRRCFVMTTYGTRSW